MPIRFACEHCGQRLSVGEDRAGIRARCPKCGQRVVVPAAPVTDSATAMGSRPALASSNQPASDSRPGPQPQDSQPPRATASPTTVKKLDSAPAATAANRAGVAASQPRDGQASESSVSRSVEADTVSGSARDAARAAWTEDQRQPEVATKSPDVPPRPPSEQVGQADDTDDDSLYDEFVVYDDELVEDRDDQATDSEVALRSLLDRVAVPRGVLYAQGILLAVVGLTGFVLGLLFHSEEPSASEQVALPQYVDVSGSVVIRDESENDRPDAGAVVLVVPRDSRPEAEQRVDVAGFRPGDPEPAEDNPALQALYRLGGTAARASSEGRFQIRLPAGDYYVLVLSRNRFRPSSQQPTREDLSQIGRYFKLATALMGESAYRWQAYSFRRDQTLQIVF